jgi:hypothetical protein
VPTATSVFMSAVRCLVAAQKPRKNLAPAQNMTGVASRKSVRCRARRGMCSTNGKSIGMLPTKTSAVRNEATMRSRLRLAVSRSAPPVRAVVSEATGMTR